jgi:hypothetical protein
MAFFIQKEFVGRLSGTSCNLDRGRSSDIIREDVRIGRIILGVMLSVALLVSLAPGNPSERPVTSQKAHACCHKDKDSAPAKNKCDGGPCTMQCCRIIPAQGDAVPALEDCTPLVEIVIAVPTSLHSLTDPQAIFHPPRA